MLLRTLIFYLIGLTVADQSPVFLWGTQSPTKPSMQVVTQNDFAALIAPMLKDHMIIAIQEENLTSSDFLCSNENTLQSCYAQLQGVSPKTYYASVENPIDGLHSLTAELEFNNIEESGKLQKDIICTPGKIIFINFAKSPSQRAQLLESHDTVISSITRNINCPTTFLYTSSPSSGTVNQKRLRRDTAASSNGYLFRVDGDFLIYFSNLYLVNNGQKTELVISSISLNNKNATGFSISLADEAGKTLTFLISLSGGYYTMSSLQYDGINFFTNGINAPTTFSYFCGDLSLQGIGTVTESSKYSLLWNSVQFQAPFSGTPNTTFVFGDPWHCVGFFTPGILMGLFLVVLLLFITFTGISWMMDINTMDRFDDPKGKTITINATE